MISYLLKVMPLVANVLLAMAATAMAATAMAATAMADSSAPLHLANRSPLVAIYGLPLAASGKLLDAGEQQWQLDLTVANSFRVTSSEREALYLDGETSNARLGWSINLLSSPGLGLVLRSMSSII